MMSALGFAHDNQHSGGLLALALGRVGVAAKHQRHQFGKLEQRNRHNSRRRYD